MTKKNEPRKPRKTTTNESMMAFMLTWEMNPTMTEKELEAETHISASLIGKYIRYARTLWGIEKNPYYPEIGTKGGITPIADNVIKKYCNSHGPILVQGKSEEKTGSYYKQMEMDEIEEEIQEMKSTVIQTDTVAETDLYTKLIEKYGDFAAKEGRIFKISILSFELGGKAE